MRRGRGPGRGAGGGARGGGGGGGRTGGGEGERGQLGRRRQRGARRAGAQRVLVALHRVCGDARRLDENFEGAAFGAVVDKGTVDAIYLSAGETCGEDIGAVARGASRILEPRGAFLVVSLSAPRYIWPLLQCDAWDASQCEVRRLDGAFLYVMRRGRLKKK